MATKAATARDPRTPESLPGTRSRVGPLAEVVDTPEPPDGSIGFGVRCQLIHLDRYEIVREKFKPDLLQALRELALPD